MDLPSTSVPHTILYGPGPMSADILQQQVASLPPNARNAPLSLQQHGEGLYALYSFNGHVVQETTHDQTSFGHLSNIIREHYGHQATNWAMGMVNERSRFSASNISLVFDAAIASRAVIDRRAEMAAAEEEAVPPPYQQQTPLLHEQEAVMATAVLNNPPLAEVVPAVTGSGLRAVRALRSTTQQALPVAHAVVPNNQPNS